LHFYFTFFYTLINKLTLVWENNSRRGLAVWVVDARRESLAEDSRCDEWLSGCLYSLLSLTAKESNQRKLVAVFVQRPAITSIPKADKLVHSFMGMNFEQCPLFTGFSVSGFKQGDRALCKG
jgi:hypothetical protein